MALPSVTAYGSGSRRVPSRAYTSWRSIVPRSARQASRACSADSPAGSTVSASSRVSSPGQYSSSNCREMRPAGSCQPVWNQVLVRTGGDVEAGSSFVANVLTASVSNCSTMPKPRNSRSTPSKWPWW